MLKCIRRTVLDDRAKVGSKEYKFYYGKELKKKSREVKQSDLHFLKEFSVSYVENGLEKELKCVESKRLP